MKEDEFTGFEKLEKREDLVRKMRNQLALGRMTHEVFRAKVAEIDRLYRLTPTEERAIELYLRRRRRKQ